MLLGKIVKLMSNRMGRGSALRQRGPPGRVKDSRKLRR